MSISASSFTRYQYIAPFWQYLFLQDVCLFLSTSWRHQQIACTCLDGMCRVVVPLLALFFWWIDMAPKKKSAAHCFRQAIPPTVTTILGFIFHIQREEEKGNTSALLRRRLENSSPGERSAIAPLDLSSILPPHAEKVKATTLDVFASASAYTRRTGILGMLLFFLNSFHFFHFTVGILYCLISLAGDELPSWGGSGDYPKKWKLFAFLLTLSLRLVLVSCLHPHLVKQVMDA